MNQVFDVREFEMNSGDDMALHSVSHSNTDGLVNIVVRGTSDFRLILNVNMKDVSDTSWIEYRPSMTVQSISPDFVYGDHSLYLSIKTSNQ